VQGLYDVRVQPRLWLAHSSLLLTNGDPGEARRWADKALEASLRYDDPTSSAIVDARNAIRNAK
jgi:serine/threonine-protein kinase